MLDFNDKRILKNPRTIPELEEVVSQLKQEMYRKYYIDYLGIHIIDRESKYMISRLDHERWHDFYWQDEKIKSCPAIEQLSVLDKNQQIILFFQTYQTRMLYEARGEIIGKITPGCSILLGDRTSGNRIQFCITFKDDKSIDKLNASILMNLISDLNQVKTILNPFMEYFTQVGNMEYTETLKEFVNKKRLKFVI